MQVINALLSFFSFAVLLGTQACGKKDSGHTPPALAPVSGVQSQSGKEYYFDHELSLKEGAKLTKLEAKIFKDISAKKPLQIGDIQAAHFETSLAEKDLSEKEASQIVLDFQSRYKELLRDLGTREVLEKIKPKIEKKIESITKDGRYLYDPEVTNVLDIFPRGASQCYSGTILFEYVYLGNREHSSPIIIGEHRVWILETGHILPGQIRSTAAGPRLYGFETTLRGIALKDYGETQDLNFPLRVINSLDGLVFEIFKRHMASHEQTQLRESLVRKAAKKYRIPYERLEGLIAKSALESNKQDRADLSSNPFALKKNQKGKLFLNNTALGFGALRLPLESSIPPYADRMAVAGNNTRVFASEMERVRKLSSMLTETYVFKIDPDKGVISIGLENGEIILQEPLKGRRVLTYLKSYSLWDPKGALDSCEVKAGCSEAEIAFLVERNARQAFLIVIFEDGSFLNFDIFQKRVSRPLAFPEGYHFFYMDELQEFLVGGHQEATTWRLLPMHSHLRESLPMSKIEKGDYEYLRNSQDYVFLFSPDNRMRVYGKRARSQKILLDIPVDGVWGGQYFEVTGKHLMVGTEGKIALFDLSSGKKIRDMEVDEYEAICQGLPPDMHCHGLKASGESDDLAVSLDIRNYGDTGPAHAELLLDDINSDLLKEKTEKFRQDEEEKWAKWQEDQEEEKDHKDEGPPATWVDKKLMKESAPRQKKSQLNHGQRYPRYNQYPAYVSYPK